MTGAAIVRWESAGGTVLAVHGAFDGASAWALRNDMDELPARDLVVDLTHAVEACDFAAALLAGWLRLHPGRRLRFRPGAREHARLLRAHGLELAAEDADLAPTLGFPAPRPRPAAPPSVVA
jgi:hypothetical protein